MARGLLDPNAACPAQGGWRNAGLLVTLVWPKETDTLAVRVDDVGLDHQFELAVAPGASAIDVVEHPLAYPAWRSIDHPVFAPGYAA